VITCGFFRYGEINLIKRVFKMKKLRSFKFILLLTIVISTIISGCNSNNKNIDSSKFDELTGIQKSITIHPSKIEIGTGNQSKSSKTAIIKKYKSDVPFEEKRIFTSSN
jgi:ribosomal protein L24